MGCNTYFAMTLKTCIFAAVIFFSAANAQTQPRVIGYYPMWLRNSLPPSSLTYSSLTHIMHAFAWPNADGTIASYISAPDTELTGRTHRSGVKILISLGGGGSSTNFPAVVADTLLRHSFVNNIVAFVQNANYDGVDLDWEGPASAAERVNELSFVKELRAAFTAANPSLLITMAVGVTNWSGQWHDFTSLKQSVDWFNAMTYDFHGSWSAHAGHNAPLYAPTSDVNDGSVDQGMTYLQSTRGIPASQLVMGLAFYGRQFNASALYVAKTEPTTDLFYADVPAKINGGWTYTWDAVSQVPYAFSPSKTQLAVFDDSLSLSVKCAYARAKNFSGVMIWALGEDGPGQPLMDAVGKAMTRISDVAEQSALRQPSGISLSEAYPNPFNPGTTIRFDVSTRSVVQLNVYDLLGREVAELANGEFDPGGRDFRFDGSTMASGMYFVRLQSGSATITRKIVLAR